MVSKDIKSGAEVVSDFLDSLQDNNAIDPDTLNAIRDLFQSGNLTKQQLVRALGKLQDKSLSEEQGISP